MLPFLAIGAGAGIVSALMTLSIASGSPVAIALSYVALLPLLLAGLGTHHYVAAFGLCIGGLVISFTHSPALAVVFALYTGAPAWAFCALAAWSARMNRHIPTDLLILAALIAAGLAIGIVAYIGGFDHEAYQNAVRDALKRTLQSRPLGGSAIGVVNDDVIAMFAAMLAYVVAGTTVLIYVLNLYLAGRILKASNRLHFAWPDLSATRLPNLFGAMIGVAALVSFIVSGFIGHAASLFMGAAIVALAIAGLALLHSITRQSSMRPLILFGTYALTLVFGIPALALAALGLADSQYNLRNRIKLTF